MKNLSRVELKRLIHEELIRASEEGSELSEFAAGKSGKVVIKEGQRIMSAGRSINQCAHNQTGAMRRTLGNISEFVYKIGEALSSINSLDENEGGTLAEKLPTISELKKLQKELQRLEN